MTADDARMRLSKTKIMLFQRCRKALWLKVHRPELEKIDDKTLALFRFGHLVGNLAQQQLPHGILVEAKPNIEAALAQTRELLENGCERPIFEATFQREDVLIRADVLEPDGFGMTRMIEVKNTARVGSHHIHDLGIQGWATLGQGARISSFAIRRPVTKIKSEADLGQCVFVDTDVTWHVFSLLPRKAAVVQDARMTLRGPEPQRAMGPHCSRPYACAFAEYCLTSSGGHAVGQGKGIRSRSSR